MLRCSKGLRKVVDHNSKEGKEYIAAQMKYTRNTNKLFYFFMISPLAYIPYHYYYNQPQLWANYKNPYAVPDDVETNSDNGKPLTLREKRERDAALIAAGIDPKSVAKPAAAASSPITVGIEGETAAPPAPRSGPSGGRSLWLRGGNAKESLDVRPNREKEEAAKAAEEAAKAAAGEGKQ